MQEEKESEWLRAEERIAIVASADHHITAALPLPGHVEGLHFPTP